MANKPNQKLKMLYILKALFDKTDDVNGVTTQDLIEELAYHGIDAERKSISRDITTLREFGFVIEQRRHKSWYLVSRPLKLQEMIMLVDAVQSAPFLTDKLTDELIERIKQFASFDQQKMLQRRIEVLGRVKMENEDVLQSVDVIQQAMRRKLKVEFQYFAYNTKKERVARKGGKVYVETPVRLVYADEFYYLIAFNDYWAEQGHNAFTPYRVDRMMNVRLSEEAATRDPRIANYQTEEHLTPSFGVYAAEKTTVVLEFDQSAMNPIIDKFGLDALVFERGGDRAQVSVKVPLSPQFYGWLLQLGPLVKIVHPTSAAEEFAKLLEQTQQMYRSPYRICTDTARRSISQEQFLELVEYLREKLNAHVVEDLGGIGFSSENDFNEFVWPLMEAWLAEHGIEDGMPYGLPRQAEIKGKMRTVPNPVHTERYVVYGQIVGEALVALDPRNYASDQARDCFTDVAKYSDSLAPSGFMFELLPKEASWERADHAKVLDLGHSARFELRREKKDGKMRARAFFAVPEWGIAERELEPWLGSYEGGGSMKALLKFWQMSAYRFV